MLGQQNRAEIGWIFRAQWLIAIALGTVALIFSSKSVAVSVVYGATVSLIPTALFGRMVFRYSGAKQSKKILRSLYLGEGIKLLLTALMFTTYICFFKPILSVFFVSFLLVHMVFCVAPLLRMSKGTILNDSIKIKF